MKKNKKAKMEQMWRYIHYIYIAKKEKNKPPREAQQKRQRGSSPLPINTCTNTIIKKRKKARNIFKKYLLFLFMRDKMISRYKKEMIKMKKEQKQIIFRLDKEIATNLKIYAAKNGTSVQKLMEEYAEQIAKENK